MLSTLFFLKIIKEDGSVDGTSFKEYFQSLDLSAELTGFIDSQVDACSAQSVSIFY